MRLINTTLLVVCLLTAVIRDTSALKFDPDQARIAADTERHSNTIETGVSSNDVNKSDGNNDVERAFVSGLPEALSRISPFTQKLANHLWLKSKVDPALVFNMLHLGDAAAKLDDNPRFLVWLKYVDMYASLKYRSFSDAQVLQLLQQSNSEEKLVSLFQSLRKIPARKNLAEQMQIYLFEGSASARELLNKAWLKAGESPAEVFRMLHLDTARLPMDKLEGNSKFLQWFKYIEMYGESDLRTFKFLQNNFEGYDIEIAPLFQALKQRPELRLLGDNLQRFLFKTWMDRNFPPEFVRSQLALPWGTAIFELRKDHVLYKVLEEYTIYFTGKRGGEGVLKTVRDLFANDQPYKAFAIAKKLGQ